jgi:D-alanine-D-alanine ligase
MKKLRIMVLVHEDLVPPETAEGLSAERFAAIRTEFDVCSSLRGLGHDVRPLGVREDLGVIKATVDDYRPHVCFNLLEEFHGIGCYDQHVVSFLELLRQPYTGSNPRGLTLARDKALTKKILSYHRIPVPKFEVFPLNRSTGRPEWLTFPLVVKSVTEEGSAGISQASVVRTDRQLEDRVAYIHSTLGTAAIAEQYIEGRELYVAMLGNRKLQTFPIWELCLANLPDGAPRIATSRVKWDAAYQQKHGIVSQAATDLPDGAEQHIYDLCRDVYRELDLSGYARIDLRLTPEGQVYLLEANPNPQIARNEDFADSAAAGGVEYGALLQKIVSLGLNYEPLGLA